MRTVPDLLEETFFYLLFGLAILGGLVIVLVILSVPVAVILQWDGSLWFDQFKFVLLIFSLVFIFGALFNALWFLCLNEKLYVMDDPFFHFLPVLAFGSFLIDVSVVHLAKGVKIWHLRALWYISALITWIGAIILSIFVWH